MKMFQIQFHTGFVPRNAATVRFAKYVGAAPWEDGRGGGTDKRRTVETGGGPRGLLREVPLLAVMLGEAPSSGRVRWRCLSCLHTLLLSEPQGTFLSVSVCSR